MTDRSDETKQDRGQAAEASARPSTGLEGQVVILGGGILGSTPFERHTDRYGTVHLTVLDSIPGVPAPAQTIPVPDTNRAAEIAQALAEAMGQDTTARTAPARQPPSRVVAFDHAPLGASGTLVAHVLATTSDYDWGDGAPELRLPKPGERVVLGSGILFTEDYMGAPVIGVRPVDGREDNWMDRYAISRCRDHLVRLDFEMDAAGEAVPAGTGRAQTISPASPPRARPPARVAAETSKDADPDPPAQLDFLARNPLNGRGSVAAPGGQKPATNTSRRRPPQARRNICPRMGR